MNNKTEKEKMLAGELYLASDPQLTKDRENARGMTRIFNQTLETEYEKSEQNSSSSFSDQQA